MVARTLSSFEKQADILSNREHIKMVKKRASNFESYYKETKETLYCDAEPVIDGGRDYICKVDFTFIPRVRLLTKCYKASNIALYSSMFKQASGTSDTQRYISRNNKIEVYANPTNGVGIIAFK